MVLVVAAGQTSPDGLPADVVVFEAPEADPDGVFADLVGDFAASLDEGTEPDAAFRSSIASDGWTEAGGPARADRTSAAAQRAARSAPGRRAGHR